MSDPKTLRVYAEKAAEYADLTRKAAEHDPMFDRFLEACAPGGHLLDLGCGPGHYAARMAKAGFVVTATDAVPEMVRIADALPGVTAECASFDQITDTDLYDGIWANFSLLHAARSDMPRYLKALHTALKPGGKFHVAVKTGHGAKRDNINRMYTYYTLPELTGLLTAAGFTVTDHTTGNDIGMDGERADWIAVRADG
jgi:2-polyprenyl-3-methyl-5-hydroxy-6-metoxy-1,4-benzoquinol methylase